MVPKDLHNSLSLNGDFSGVLEFSGLDWVRVTNNVLTSSHEIPEGTKRREFMGDLLSETSVSRVYGVAADEQGVVGSLNMSDI